MKFYQELLNECIDISEWKKKHKQMLVTLFKMQYRLKNLKGGNSMLGKHSKEALEIKALHELLARRDKEIKDIKTECAEQFKQIKDLCFINNYSEKYMNLRKIFEIATDNFSALVKDLAITEDKKGAKIIELPTTRKRNR